jgi:hypothetical protein
MGKMKELYLEQQQAASGSGDDDYLYEQYIAQEQMNEEYWQWKSAQSHSIFPDEVQYDDEYYKSSYLPTPDEEAENYKQTKQNGYT